MFKDVFFSGNNFKTWVPLSLMFGLRALKYFKPYNFALTDFNILTRKLENQRFSVLRLQRNDNIFIVSINYFFDCCLLIW